MNETIFDNLTLDCNQPQDFSNINDFIRCVRFFLNKRSIMALFGIMLILGIILANLFVIIILCREKQKKINIFNQIIIGHCIV
jgi:hypothetical protein